jgi:hypothetical protein
MHSYGSSERAALPVARAQPQHNNRFFDEVGKILQQAHTQAFQAVNAAMVDAYWHIGKRIVEEEQGGAAQAIYGTGLLKELSWSLTRELGKGVSLPQVSLEHLVSGPKKHGLDPEGPRHRRCSNVTVLLYIVRNTKPKQRKPSTQVTIL